MGRRRLFYRGTTKIKGDLGSCLDDGLSRLGPREPQYAVLKEETVRCFGQSQLSKRVIRVGCDYLRREMRPNRSRLMSIKICAECVWLSRRTESDRELLEELKRELDAIICEANDKLKAYGNGHCESQ